MEKTKVSNNRLIKFLLISGLFILILIILSLFYLSNYGIKTSKFNKLILDRLIEVDSRISAEIEDVFLKLNLGKKEIKVITKNTNLYLEKNSIKLSEINLDIDLLSFLNNKAAIKTLKIETKENSIKNFTNFVSEFKFHPSFLFFNRIEKGYITTKAKINFDDKGKIYPNYLISGKITQAKFKLLNNDRVDNINFNFSISDDEYNLKEINLEYLKTKINSETIKVIKKNKTYSVEGNIKNKKNPIDLKKLLSLANIKFDLIDDKEIEIESDNNFAFTIDEKRKINDLKITSNLKFDKLYFNEKYQNLIYLQNGTIETEYYKNNLSLYVSSKYSFIEDEDLNIVNDKNDLNLHIVKKNNEDYVVEGSFKNKKKSIDPKDIFNLLKVENEFLSDEKITIETDNRFAFKIDEKRKINDLKITSNLKFEKLVLNYNSSKIKDYLKDYKDSVYLKDGNVDIDYSKKLISIKGNSQYSLDKKFDNLEFDILKNNNDYKFNVNLDINNSSLRVDEIKYVKEKNSNSSLIFKGSILNSNTIALDKILFTENNNNFEINQIKFNNKYKVLSIDSLVLDYDNSNKIKNNIRLSKIDNNYILEGHSIDFSKYLNHILTSDEDKSFFSNFKNLNSILNINIKKVYLDNQNYLVNLNGKFNFVNNKIENANLNSKFKNGDKFLFSIKSTNNNETVTQLHSDRAKPFVSNYKFIKGFKDGVIDFHSIKKNNVSKSVLKIDNFKVKEVPVLAKLLTLASLQGIADSLTGEGIRFTDFEMVFSNEDKLMTIDEIYSIGPAISILMEGYVVKNKLISLRGTLVPATTINRTIASIPVIGDFLIGKKVGEGVFGVSFKIKGPPKNLKTTVNPVKTLTPRFITRTLEKIKRN